ncbi:MAG: hypothetical protein LZ173_05740 [Thaumarchaeota archaeon]|jgi:hypothetical protein|nr:hypothetical protein [Candidatus Geocrenenecus arthurdayi]
MLVKYLRGLKGKSKECAQSPGIGNPVSLSEKQVQTVHDIRESIELIVSGTAIVNTEYGGFSIEVIDPVRFPYGDVITTLIKHGFEIWITLRNDRPLIIVCIKGD